MLSVIWTKCIKNPHYFRPDKCLIHATIYTLGVNHSCFISRRHTECPMVRCFGLIVPFQYMYTGAVENNKPPHFGLWHWGISKSDQCRQERDQFYSTVRISNKWPSRPRTDRKWQICAWEMHYTAPEYDCPVLITSYCHTLRFHKQKLVNITFSTTYRI